MPLIVAPPDSPEIQNQLRELGIKNAAHWMQTANDWNIARAKEIWDLGYKAGAEAVHARFSVDKSVAPSNTER